MKFKIAKFKQAKIKELKDKDDSTVPVWLTILKGSLIALSISLVGILIFAFFIKYVAISTDAIKPINQVIKGIIVLAYTVLSFIVFSILYGNFEFNKTLINDFLFGGIIGAICGIISVNFRKK